MAPTPDPTSSVIPGLPTDFVIPLLSTFNLNDHSTLRAPLFWVNGCFLFLIILCLVLRLYARLILVRKFDLADCILPINQLFGGLQD